MIKKILLIRPPCTFHKNTTFYGVGEPLGLLYIAAVIENNGYNVEILDAQLIFNKKINKNQITYGMDNSEISLKIKVAKPDLVGIGWFTACDEINVTNVCKLVKDINPNTPLVVGGSYPTLFPERVICNKNIDYIIKGEGEFKFLELVNRLNNNENLNFNGLIYKGQENNTHQSLEFVTNLDSIPFPARHLVDMQKYTEVNIKYSATVLKFRFQGQKNYQ